MPPVSPLPGASQAAVDVRVEEELGHGQPLSSGLIDRRTPALVQVGAGEAGHPGEGAVGPGDGVEDGVDLGVERVRMVAEGGHGRRPGRRQPAFVRGEVEQYARGDHPGNQPERLDQPTARTFQRGVRHGHHQRIAHQPRRLHGERLQRGLGEGAGEATVEDQVDQARKGRDDRGSRTQRPRRVLPEERLLLVQQGRQSLSRLHTRAGGERVDGRDRGHLVRPVRDREAQIPDRGGRVAECPRRRRPHRRDRLEEGRGEVVTPDQFGVNRLAHAHELALSTPTAGPRVTSVPTPVFRRSARDGCA